MNKKLKKIIESQINFRLNKNQSQEIERLLFEISRRQNKPILQVLNQLIKKSKVFTFEGKNKFFTLKKTLIQWRFPLSSKCFNSIFESRKIFLSERKKPFLQNWQVSKKFKPLSVFCEKETKNSYLVKKIKNKFPEIKIKEISSLKNYIKKNKFKITNFKKPSLFIVNQKHDFLKPCPCTKNHISCGYWIFNLGFGCPFDCSYCYLQQYSNTPGIILPVNLKDYFKQFNQLEKKIKKPIRIGTGEFSDSLALDHITGYSRQLISYFRGKKVLFELKTKSIKIENILKEKPAPNIIISWSLSPPKIIYSQEKGTPSLKERLAAAQRIQAAGFKVGFHLDPIIAFQNWQKNYKNLIEKIYANLNPPFAWISLGTLRCHRGLKPISEQRFPESNIFYGELFLANDKKLRYPKFLRQKIYTETLTLIRKFDSKTPVYLCMESKDIWQAVNRQAAIQKQAPLTLGF